MNFLKSPLLIAAAALCAPAMAQQSAPPAEAAGPAPVEPAAPSAAAPASVTPTQIVDREFAAYDLDKSGDLNAAEFSAWVSKLRKPAPDAGTSTDTQSWSAGLFASADTDHNQLVSKTEMTTLLSSVAKG